MPVKRKPLVSPKKRSTPGYAEKQPNKQFPPNAGKKIKLPKVK